MISRFRKLAANKKQCNYPFGFAIFAAICNDHGTSFFVTAFPDGDNTRYMFSTTHITEEKLNIKDLSSKDQRELAGQYITAAMELRKSKLSSKSVPRSA